MAQPFAGYVPSCDNLVNNDNEDDHDDEMIMMFKTSGNMWRREVDRRTPAPKQSRQEVEII